MLPSISMEIMAENKPVENIITPLYSIEKNLFFTYFTCNLKKRSTYIILSQKSKKKNKNFKMNTIKTLMIHIALRYVNTHIVLLVVKTQFLHVTCVTHSHKEVVSGVHT